MLLCVFGVMSNESTSRDMEVLNIQVHVAIEEEVVDTPHNANRRLAIDISHLHKVLAVVES